MLPGLQQNASWVNVCYSLKIAKTTISESIVLAKQLVASPYVALSPADVTDNTVQVYLPEPTPNLFSMSQIHYGNT